MQVDASITLSGASHRTARQRFGRELITAHMIRCRISPFEKGHAEYNKSIPLRKVQRASLSIVREASQAR